MVSVRARASVLPSPSLPHLASLRATTRSTTYAATWHLCACLNEESTAGRCSVTLGKAVETLGGRASDDSQVSLLGEHSQVLAIHRQGVWLALLQAPVGAEEAVRELDVYRLDPCMGAFHSGLESRCTLRLTMRSSPGVQALSLPGLYCLVFLNLPFASSSCKCFLGPHEKSANYNLPMPTTNQSSEHHLFHLSHIAFGWLSDSPCYCTWCYDFCLDILGSKYMELFTFWMWH